MNIRPVYTALLMTIIFSAWIIRSALSQAPFIQKVRIGKPVSENSINTAIQDRNGFIWLGSDQGLFRFDGAEFKHYTLDSDSVGFKVLSLHESPDGLLWIGCGDGRIYRLIKDRLHLFTPEEGTAGEGISKIITDEQGTLWWSTLGEGIYFYYNDRVYNINHQDGLKEDYVYDLLEDQYGRIWAGTDAGLAICSHEAGNKKIEIPGFNDLLPDPIVKVLKTDHTGKIYLGFYESPPGFVSRDGNEFRSLTDGPEWNYGPLSDLEVLPDVVWISTNSGRLIETGQNGIHEIKSQDASGYILENFGKIHELLQDKEGNVWIIAASGVYRSTGSKLRFYYTAGDVNLQNIHAISVDNQELNNIWFSNEEGLFVADLSTKQNRKFLDDRTFKNLKVTCLCQDHYGYMWAGTFNYGVFRIKPADGTWTRITEKEGLVNDNVLSISSHNDTLWMATLGGATEIQLDTRLPGGIGHTRSYNRSNGLVSNYIYSVYEDKADRIWFATDGDGISILDKSRFISYNNKQGLGDDVIYSICGDQYGNAWIATASAGIYQFDGYQFKHFGTEEGLSMQPITGLITIRDEVVVIMENGLDLIHIPYGIIVHLGEEMGLAGISSDLNTVSYDPAGYLWIGTNKGIIRYQPSLSKETPGPKTILEQMAVFLEPVEMKHDLILGSKKNHVTFSYKGLWLTNPEKVNYQVMLEGYDLGWKNTFDPSAIYSSLPPGKYTFRVRSSLNQSFKNASEASFYFTIRHPLWSNPWFILVIILLVAFFIFIFIRSREKKLRRIEQQKKEKVEFEFQMLKNQVNPHFLFNSFSTLMALIEEQPRQAIEYTEKLSDFFRVILQLKDEEVIPLRQELNIVEDYFFLLKKRFGNSIDLKIMIPEDLKETFIPPMTLQILIENAVKHNVISRDKPLKVRIFSNKDEIVIENNLQPKKTREVSTGIGLENISKRYRLKAKKEPEIIKSDELFRVILPVITTI